MDPCLVRQDFGSTEAKGVPVCNDVFQMFLTWRYPVEWCIPTGAQALELLLGSESAYVRDIVTEELAKGLDAYWRLSADDALDAVRANLLTLLGVRSSSSFQRCLVAGLCMLGSPGVPSWLSQQESGVHTQHL